jgi:hypothetical protein
MGHQSRPLGQVVKTPPFHGGNRSSNLLGVTIFRRSEFGGLSPLGSGFLHGPVVQLVRMPACHAGGRRFEPVPGRHYAGVAQLAEQLTCNQQVAGSSPITSSIKSTLSH